MTEKNTSLNLFNRLILKFFAVEEKPYHELQNPKHILIVRQHNKFADMLASASLFRAVKETYPNCKLTVVVSPENTTAVTSNEYIDNLFIFNRLKLFLPSYWLSLINVLKVRYDLIIVPAVISISKTSCVIGRLAKGEYRVGPKSLDGKVNPLADLFHKRIPLNWRKYPDMHVSDFSLEIVRPVGISTKNFHSTISYDQTDLKKVENFLGEMEGDASSLLVGLHVGARKPSNRWSLDKFMKVITKLNENYNAQFYMTGSNLDVNEIEYIKERLEIEVSYFLNKPIPQLAALIAKSDLFITNDTGVMHVAGATETPQISIFGPTNPFNWAPLGPNKHFVRKSDLIDDVTFDDVYYLCEMILGDKNKRD